MLQQETVTTHVSKFPHLLHSRPAGLGLLVEPLTRGVEHPPDILAHVCDFAFDAFDAFEVLPMPY